MGHAVMVIEAEAKHEQIANAGPHRAFASVSVDRRDKIAPVYTTNRCLERGGWQLADVDLLEANEAFAADAFRWQDAWSARMSVRSIINGGDRTRSSIKRWLPNPGFSCS